MIYIDTHCHFDAIDFNSDRLEIYNKIQEQNIYIFCMSVETLSFDKVINLSKLQNIYFALGIHPLYSKDCTQADIDILQEYIKNNLTNPKFLGIGEIGLDGMYNVDFKQQIFIYEEQLKLAKNYNLPVFLHIRKSQDKVLKYLRKYSINKGIAHAFNGSIEQAENFIKQGLMLGFGGTLTYDRALNIKKLAREIDINHIVLETDAPDMSPSWQYNMRNTPLNIIKIYEVMSNIKNISINSLSSQILNNVSSFL